MELYELDFCPLLAFADTATESTNTGASDAEAEVDTSAPEDTSEPSSRTQTCLNRDHHLTILQIHRRIPL